MRTKLRPPERRPIAENSGTAPIPVRGPACPVKARLSAAVPTYPYLAAAPPPSASGRLRGSAFRPSPVRRPPKA
jgi:hypothetical protein